MKNPKLVELKWKIVKFRGWVLYFGKLFLFVKIIIDLEMTVFLVYKCLWSFHKYKYLWGIGGIRTEVQVYTHTHTHTHI